MDKCTLTRFKTTFSDQLSSSVLDSLTHIDEPHARLYKLLNVFTGLPTEQRSEL